MTTELPSKPDPPGPDRRSIPWEEIRLKFLSDPDLSLAALAREYELDRWQVWRKAQEDRWQEERQKCLEEVATTVRQQIAARVAQQLGDRLEDLARVRRKILARVEAQLDPDASPEPTVDVREVTKGAGGGKTGKETRKGDGSKVRHVEKREKLLIDPKVVEAVLKAEGDALDTILKGPDQNLTVIRIV
jgi:hypothetical protein